MWSTDLEADEIVTAIGFQVRRGRCGYAIEEFTRRSGDFAMAGAAIAVRLDADSRIESAAIGLIGLAPTPVRARTTEAGLVGRSIDDIDVEEIGRSATAGLDSVTSDVHGSADYRRRVGAAMVVRAWRRAVEEASDD